MKPWGPIALLTLLALPLRADDIEATFDDDAAVELFVDEQGFFQEVNVGLLAKQERGPGFKWMLRVGVADGGGHGDPFELPEWNDVPTEAVDDDSSELGSASDSASSVSSGIRASGASLFVVDLNSDGQIDSADLVYYDFGDLNTYNFRYDLLRVSDRQSLRALEVVGQHLWTRRDGILNQRPAWRVNGHGPLGLVEAGRLPVADRAPADLHLKLNADGWFRGYEAVNYLAYGMRVSDGRDRYVFDIHSERWGRSFSDTKTHHYTVGPTVAIGRVVSKGPWRFDASGHLMLGYGHMVTDQFWGFGVTATPGALNNSIIAQPTQGHHRRQWSRFAQHAELRVTSSYAVRPNVSVDLTFRGFVTGPWDHSRELVQYSTPSWGLTSSDANAYAGYNAYVGMTYFR